MYNGISILKIPIIEILVTKLLSQILYIFYELLLGIY